MRHFALALVITTAPLAAPTAPTVPAEVSQQTSVTSTAPSFIAMCDGLPAWLRNMLCKD